MVEPLLIIEREPDEVLDEEGRHHALALIEDRALVDQLSDAAVVAKRFELAFYGDVTLLEWTSPDWPAQTRVCFLEYGEQLLRLDGTSPPIHQVNASADLVLTEANVLDYLAFFCFFVRGTDGPFLVVDRQDHPMVPAVVRTPEFHAKFRAPQLFGRSRMGNFLASTTVYYSNALFVADFRVILTGMVEMADDAPVLADLAARVEVPLAIGDSIH